MIRGRAPLLAILALSLGLNVTAVSWGLPSRFAWAPDELQPSDHPPRHRRTLFGRLASTRLSAVSLLPAGGVVPAPSSPSTSIDLDSVSGRTLLYYLGRAISLAMGVGILDRPSTPSGSRSSAGAPRIFASLAAAVTAPFVYYAKFANLDVPVSFWVLLSLYFFVRYVKTESRARRLTVFTVMAVFWRCAPRTRPTRSTCSRWGSLMFRRFRPRRSRSIDRTMWRAAAAIAAVLFLIVHNVVPSTSGASSTISRRSSGRGVITAASRPDALEPARPVRADPCGTSASDSVGRSRLASVVGRLARRHRQTPSIRTLFGSLLAATVLLPLLHRTGPQHVAPLQRSAHPDPLPVRGPCSGARVWSSTEVVVSRRASPPCPRLLVPRTRPRSTCCSSTIRATPSSDWLRETRSAPGETVGFVGPEYYLPRLEGVDSRTPPAHVESVRRACPPRLPRREPGICGALRAPARGKKSSSRSSQPAAPPYGLALRHQSHAAWHVPRLRAHVLGNMAKANPVIEVYERAE